MAISQSEGIKKSLLNIGSELASSKDFKRINEDNPGNSSGNKSSKSIEAARKRKRTILSSIENRESIIAEFNINDARKTLDHIVRNDINSIENFAKDVLPNIINIEDQDEIKKYYGFFSKNYTKFCIPPGIKKSLLNIGSELASSKDFKRINEDNPGNSSGNKSSKSIEAARKRKRTILSSIENRESIIAEFNINDARKTLDHIVRKDIGNETSDNLCENNSDCSSHTGCKSKQSCYKWKQIKYSRQERKRRKRESALIDSQIRRSHYRIFPSNSKIETIITKEPEHVIGTLILFRKT
ncbi:hypothetical protein FQR65_LT04355 [Abscondita terminalis]|nr:hypothetical protein FQR65_LT04355 [Abscondita terminalis]